MDTARELRAMTMAAFPCPPLPMIGVIGLIAAGVATWYRHLASSERPVLMAGTAATLALLTWISFSPGFLAHSAWKSCSRWRLT